MSLMCSENISREALYRGVCFLLPLSEASQTFVSYIRGLVEEAFQTRDLLSLHRMKNEIVLKKLSDVRKVLQENPLVLEYQYALIRELLWDPSDFFIDIPRLRMVTPHMHSIPAAAPAFYAHRDTWYANPEEQINVWIPLDDYQAEETFSFYRSYFARAIKNDSDSFEYQQWKKETGFQNLDPQRSIYPKALSELPLIGETFSCERGQRLIFSAQHLHRTRENRGDRTRISVDFRIVHRGDFEQKRGPLNQDNASKGSVLTDYLDVGKMDQERFDESD